MACRDKPTALQFQHNVPSLTGLMEGHGAWPVSASTLHGSAVCRASAVPCMGWSYRPGPHRVGSYSVVCQRRLCWCCCHHGILSFRPLAHHARRSGRAQGNEGKYWLVSGQGLWPTCQSSPPEHTSTQPGSAAVMLGFCSFGKLKQISMQCIVGGDKDTVPLNRLKGSLLFSSDTPQAESAHIKVQGQILHIWI